MKKRIELVISLAVTLALTLSLALPALAYEDTDPPQWEQWGYASLEELLEDLGITEEEYYEIYAASALDYEAYLEELERRQQAWLDAHPDEVAAFDPYAYFAQEYPWYDSPQEYMQFNELTEEAFRREMLNEWASGQIYLEQARQDKLQEKLDAGGFAEGLNVMVDGVCIPFPDARPELRDGRTMVPLAAAMEYLGAQVSYDQASHTARVSMGELSFTHAIGTAVLSLDDGSQINMDVSSYVKDGRTMVPVAFFAQALGYEVYWDGVYETAVLLDRQGLVEEIDAQFTLVNRLLYTLSGGDLRREGQSLKSDLDLELVVTMLDSLNGDKSYTARLDGTGLDNGSVSNVKYTADLGALMDLALDNIPSYYLDDESRRELEDYRALLSRLSLEVIADTQRQCLYLRCPQLAQLGLMESPDAWAALPLDGLEYMLNAGELTVGGLLVTSCFSNSYYHPFHAWSYAVSDAQEGAALIGDSCFTKSGSSYTLSYTEENEWWYGYGDEAQTLDVLLKLTPSGQKGCSYALTMESRSPESLMTYELTGSSGRVDLEMTFHLKNTVKGTLEMAGRYSATRQQPQAQPPEGDKVEYPAGVLGSGNLDAGLSGR